MATIVTKNGSGAPLAGDLVTGELAIDLTNNKLYSKNSGGSVVQLGTGTVTSVAATVPTGLAIAGSPVTSSGTLAISLASGYSIPTTTKQGQWDTAYTFVSSGGTVSGTVKATRFTETYASLSGTSVTVNCSTANAFSITLSGNTTFTFSNPPSSGTAYAFTLEVTQDTTARTITWPASVDWGQATAPTISTTSGAKDIFVFYTRDGGTTWYGFTSGQAMG